MKDEEKAELLKAFFTSVFNRQIHSPEDKQSPELADSDQEQTRPPAVLEEIISDLQSH